MVFLLKIRKLKLYLGAKLAKNLDICKKNEKKYKNLLLFQKKLVILQPVYY